MATKSLPTQLIDIVVANLHLEPKAFFTSPLRDNVVATMPSAEKKQEYANILKQIADITAALPGEANKTLRENTVARLEESAVSLCRTWFKGTVFDACYSPLKSAKGAGDEKYAAVLDEIRRNAVGAPADTFGTDVRAIFASLKITATDAEMLASIRATLTNTPPYGDKAEKKPTK